MGRRWCAGRCNQAVAAHQLLGVTVALGRRLGWLDARHAWAVVLDWPALAGWSLEIGVAMDHRTE